MRHIKEFLHSPRGSLSKTFLGCAKKSFLKILFKESLTENEKKYIKNVSVWSLKLFISMITQKSLGIIQQNCLTRSKSSHNKAGLQPVSRTCGTTPFVCFS